MTAKLDFDIHFDFRSDCGGKDPDIGSPTLRRYHRLLWSKKLPNGEIMQLTHDNGGYLKWGDFELSSDAMINGLFYERAQNSIPELKRILRDYDEFVDDFEHRSWTIGGEILFPRHDNSMNQLRGTNPYIKDRWDLTLECIRRFYLGEESPLFKVLDRDRAFYELFVDFKGYVDFFFLQDGVSEDYSNVLFWQDDCELKNTMPLPKSPGEHLVWLEKSLGFVAKRAERMKRALECDDEYRNVATWLSKDDMDYRSLAYADNYYEMLDEVLNMLKNEPSLDVSTKRLRATPYANGYARYVKINGYSCAILFDKANWQDPDSVMTPFWLGVTDSTWKLSDSIRRWIDDQDNRQIANKWQKQPCLALVPIIDKPFHEICINLKQQIITAISEINSV